jgi:Peptidase inhibitor family I36
MFKASVIIVFLLTCVGSANAQYPYGGPRFYGCVAFEHADFGGAQLPIRANSSIGYLSRFWNDRISSLACAPGCEITTFEHANFGGRRQTWAGNVPFVGRGWNDRISSMVVECGR